MAKKRTSTKSKTAEQAEEKVEETAPEAPESRYSVEEAAEIRRTALAHQMRGRPELARQIRNKLDNDEEIDEALLDVAGAGRVPELPEPPPRRGPGASAKNWRKFAHIASDLDEDIIEDTKLEDLIKMLEANGVIEPETKAPDRDQP